MVRSEHRWLAVRGSLNPENRKRRVSRIILIVWELDRTSPGCPEEAPHYLVTCPSESLLQGGSNPAQRAGSRQPVDLFYRYSLAPLFRNGRGLP